MIYFITGGTGFVGSHMIDFLLKKEEDSFIYVLKRWRSSNKNIKHLFSNSRVKFVEGDLLDIKSLMDIIKGFKSLDYVYHFASQSYPAYSFQAPISTLMTNVIGTVNLLEVLKNFRDLGLHDPLIISVSSSEVYGNPTPEEVPIKETNSIRAANPYSISKVAHDLMSQYYYKAYGMRIIVTRMFSHEGPRRGEVFALSNFAYQIVSHEKSQETKENYLIKVGNLNSVRTYSHIDDAIYAYYLCAKKGKVGEIYNIGGNYTCTVGDALENMLSKSIIPKEKFQIIVDPLRVRPTDITLQIPDCTKFKQDTGWSAKKSLDDITNDLLQYWRKEL
uniref:SDR family oxidoreductase n=1 Tax=Dictyoglomus turgidum TaxID=513050 RepID=A0A7C3SQ40_9BACT